jgi:hypothetical protein
LVQCSGFAWGFKAISNESFCRFSGLHFVSSSLKLAFPNIIENDDSEDF